MAVPRASARVDSYWSHLHTYNNTMLLQVVPLLFTCATAQFLLPFNAVVSHYKGYTFDLHPDTHLLTVRNINNCFFIRITKPLEKAFTDTSTRNSIEEEIFGYIENNLHVTKTSLVQTTIDFRDGASTSSCLGRDLFRLVYPSAKPTSTITTSDFETTTGRSNRNFNN